MPDLMTHFGRLGPWYTGADADLGAGDMIEPGHGSKRRAPGGRLVWMHEDPAEARRYGAHLYQVEPTGILYDDSADGGPGSWSHAGPARIVRKLSLLEHFGAWHPGPHYHGTRAELEPGDLIEPGKYPPTMPDPDIRGEHAEEPREHVYFTPRKQYITEHYGPNVYQVEPTGDYTRDPEYGSRTMFRSKAPLRVVRKVTRDWGTEASLLAHFAAAGHDWYHGTPDERNWETGARYGIHVGTEEVAHIALNARIGRPADGRPWDGTREYGKTLLNRDRGGYRLDRETRTWSRWVEHHEPTLPTGHATYSDGKTPVPMDARPNVFPVRITGPMVNTPDNPSTDEYANGRMAGQIKRGQARRGYYYRNVGEGLDTISAAVPDAAHLERLDRQRHEAAKDDPTFPNTYHGTRLFGGRLDWAGTWFHGTRGAPEFTGRRGHAQDELSKPPEERQMHGGWAQPNQLLGVHFSPLHEVAHKFAGSVSSTPSAVVHARLHFQDPAHFPTEHHLNIAMADWGSKHYPHWHNDKLNSSMAWNYSDTEGTHRDFSRAPDNPRQLYRLGNAAQSLLQWHPHMPEILQGFTRDLREHGHRGITYGNGLEGPYETDAGRGGEAAMKYITKRKDWPDQHPYSISAIAQPEDIQTVHVEHISPWREEPKAHERTWEDVSDGDEGDAMRDRILDYHREHGGEYPRDPRSPRTAAYQGAPLYHGSLREHPAGTVLTPGDRDPEGSIWSGDYVYATENPEAARYFGSQHDTSPLTDRDVYVHRVEPVGAVEPDEFPAGAEREEFRHGNYRARALRVLDSRRVPGHYASRTAALEVRDYKGTPGDNSHITRNEYGLIPTSAIAAMPGVRGEVPGEHRNMDDEDEWPQFKEDIARNGIQHPVFITVNHGEEPRLSEGNHRRDAAVELGISHVPAEIRYFGHAEQQGTVLERHQHRQACLTCGCDEPHNRHGDERNITIEDLEGAADWADISVGQAVKNLDHAVQHEKGRKHSAARQMPVTETGPLYHGTTAERAQAILEHGFTGGAGFESGTGNRQEEGVVFLTRHPDLAMDYAHGRVQKDGGGVPAVLRIERIRGVSAAETGYMNPELNRRAGADYMDKHAEMVVLNPGIIHGITRYAANGSMDHYAGDRGDRHVRCEQGHLHWGAYGAAGLLIRHRGEDGQMRYLLQKRSPYVNEPDTWSTPGGALHYGESPERGAMREAREELGPLPRSLVHHHTDVTTDHGDWQYHTVVMDAPEHFNTRGGGETDFETAGSGWHTADEIKEMRDRGDLHPAFAESWPRVHKTAIDWHKPMRPICGTCGHYKDAHPSFDRLYHGTSPANRHSIRDTGLGVEYEQGYGSTEPGVYMSPRPDEHNTDQDIWEVDTRGLHVHPDDTGNMYEFRDVGGSYFSAEDIPPERLKLHYKGRGNKWTGFPPKEAVVTPGSLPPEQQAAFDVEDLRAHRNQIAQVGKYPPPGTRVWRGERRRTDEEPETIESTGMHWSANPDAIITGWAHPGEKHVVWQGVIEDHEKQAFPRSHPIWSGKHMSFDWEAETRFRPGAHVKVEGAYVHTPEEYEGGVAGSPGYLVPNHPERTNPGWKWHPLDRHIRIRHGGYGASDYSDLGIERESSARAG